MYVCHKAIGELVCKIDKNELITLCIKHDICVYCGGSLRIDKQFKTITRMSCRECGREFLKQHEPEE